MMAFRWTLAFLCLVGLSSAADWTNFIVKFGKEPNPGVDSFFELPRTVRDAENIYWQQTNSDASEFFSTYCPVGDARICVLYDNQGVICGYQLAITTKIEESKIPEGVMPINQGFEKATLFGEDFYITRMFFVSLQVLANGGRSWDGLTGDQLWLQIGDEFVQIPRNESELLPSVPSYIKQNCFPRMGQHYFYNAKKDAQPTDYKPFFVLYDKEGSLIGYGMVMFGSNIEGGVEQPGKTNWLEVLPSAAIRAIAPSTPDWVLETIDNHGAYSQHIYFVEKPWEITC